MRPHRAFLAILTCVTAGCAALLGIEDTTDNPPFDDRIDDASTRVDALSADEANELIPFEDDGSSDQELPPLEDAGYADVGTIDAQVTSCAENGLVARWKMNEGTGNVVADCSGNGLHGLITNATWTTHGSNGALLFKTKGWVGFANPSLLRITGAITVTAWVRCDRQTSDTEYLVGKTSNPGTNGWRLGVIDTTRQLAFASPSTAGFFNVVGGSMPIGGWRHIAALFDPNKHSEVYISGARVGVHGSGTPSAMVSSSAEARIGARFDGAYGFTGGVSDVRVYNRALSASEIAAISKQ